MPDSLKSKTISALSWSFLESIGLQSVRFVIGILLARLLFPEQFGLIAMLMIFIAVSQSFLDSGFRAALIQKHTVTQLDTCSIFYFNIVVGMAAAGLLCLIAPWIADFYIQPTLTPLTRVLSLVIVINSFGLIQDAIITKQLNFKIKTKIIMIAGTLSGIIGVAMAIIGFGVWSLVGQQVSSAFFRTISLWFFSPWRPAMIFSFNPLREMFGFGSRLLFSDLLNRIFDNIYLLVIGRLFSATDLGFFTRAKMLQELPSDTLAAMFGRVTFPVFSTIQNDTARLKRAFKKVLTSMVLVNFPMMIGLAIIARPLVLVLLTEKWAPCIPYMQLFCVIGLLYPLHVINLDVLTALGRSDLYLRLEFIKKALIVVNIAITWQWGISAMIYGMIAVSIVSYYLNSYYTGVLIGCPLWDQLQAMVSYLIFAVIMGIVVYAAGMLPLSSYWFMLLVQIIIGIIIYVFLCWQFRMAAFFEILQVVSDKISFLRTRTAG